MIGERVSTWNAPRLTLNSGDDHSLVLMVVFSCAYRSRIYFLTWAGTFRVFSVSWISPRAMEQKHYAGLQK